MLATKSSNHMLPAERRAVVFLALIYAVRMVGLFVVFPVLALHAQVLSGVTPLLIGIAIGIYGFTQALLQIPFGLWSDRYGRRRIIIIGLLVFAAGSVLAAVADTIYMLILGRALQGAGAVAGVVMALVADLTRDSQRSKAMAAIGASIGVAFLCSMVAGPVLYAAVGGSGIFYLTALTALLAIGCLQWGVPVAAPVLPVQPRAGLAETFSMLWGNPPLLAINLGIFMLHAVLTAAFVVIPTVLRDTVGLPVSDQWQVYLLTMLGGLCLMLPCLLYAEKTKRIRALLIVATACLLISQLGLGSGYGKSFYGFAAFLCLFFTAFNALEALFPSLVSKIAPAERKGAAMGMYATCQFLGAFAGGAIAGWSLKHWGSDGVFMATALFALLWLPLAFGIKMLPGLDWASGKSAL
jgi:MFS family permease